jgi:glycosyltransferase involved in cell wall biosynthesis
LGGFDGRFSPAYYEDTDLAFQVRTAGYRVVYQPLSGVVHFEGISNGKSEHSGIKKYQITNKLKFHSKWKHVLASYGTCTPKSLPADRAAKSRVLVIDATTPTPDKDSGSMDAYNYMRIIRELGFHVTFVPENVVFCDDYTRDLQRRGVECVYLPWIRSPKEAIRRYGPEADIIMLCRVNVAAPLVDVVRRYAPRARILFDTVDLHFLRESRETELFGSSMLGDKVAHTREVELEVIRKADATILRSTHEMELLRELIPDARLFHFPIVRDIPGPSGILWAARRDIVFIGGFAHPPNADAVKYFVSEVWPLLQVSGFSERLIIVGSNMPDRIAALAADNIIVYGFVRNLADIFGKCHLSVAPLRYGAGVKGKVVTSLSYGVPCVATPIAAEGSGLVPNENILVAEDAHEMAKMIQALCVNEQLWNKLSQSGLLYCEEKFSIRATKKIINNALSELLTT